MKHVGLLSLKVINPREERSDNANVGNGGGNVAPCSTGAMRSSTIEIRPDEQPVSFDERQGWQDKRNAHFPGEPRRFHGLSNS
jgi:hypothetical protein